MAEYWDKYWNGRRSRRRFLGGAAATGVGAASLALVGCGDDDNGGSTPGASDLATPTPGANASPTAADPFAGAKKGGTYNDAITGDPPSIDPYGNLSFLTKGIVSFPYSRLFKYGTGVGKAVADLVPVPDIAQGAEPSPDGLVWTIKLRPDVKFHNIDPVNGRNVNADDVKYSWSRQIDPKNANSPRTTFVDKFEVIDPTTVKFTLKAPNAAFTDLLADANLLWIMPSEADGKFDPATKMIGSGPWIFESYQPNVSFQFKKNPDWYLSGFPLMDAVNMPIIPEYPSRLAQFLAGNLDTEGIVADDLVSTKQKIGSVQYYGEVSQLLSFFYFDNDPASPWQKDPRVRQAISMCLDRDTLTEVGYNTKKLRDAGLDVKSPWNNFIPAGLTRFWLDPQGPDMGENAKYFKHDIAEAKKLLEAAGFKDGFTTKYQYTANRYGATFNTIAETNIQMLQDIGIKVETEVQDYSSTYITQTFAGNFKGIAFGYETPFPEAGGYARAYTPGDTGNHGHINDPEVVSMFAKQQQELDPAKRKEIFYDIQRYVAGKMYYVPDQAGAGTGFTAYQPWIKNALEINTVPGSYPIGTETIPFRWKDK